jgi:S-adenosylmethionine decarboxylase proenzyme
MDGWHLTADLGGCDSAQPWMVEPDALRALCVAAVRGSGLTPVAELFHTFPPAQDGSPGGVTGVVLLAESHLAVHTWPERGAVTLDAFVCNHTEDNSAHAEALMQALLRAMRPAHVEQQRLRRRTP